MTRATSRKSIPDRVAYRVWAAAAGRCTLCNQSVLANDDLGEPVPIGELAHNVGATTNSPRGESDFDRDERVDESNLLLVCRNCHKPIDDGGQVGRWRVEELREKKRAHEERIRRLTAIGADQAAYVVRLVGPIRDVPANLSREAVLTAATAAGFYPQFLPEAHYADVDLDLRNLAEPESEADFVQQAREVRRLADRVNDGVRRGAIERVAVFGFTRIPLLVQLGASLDDKTDTRVFQRQRVDGANAWIWPTTETTASFEFALVQQGTDNKHVAFVLALSGAIDLAELPDVDASHTVYEVRSASGSTTVDHVRSAGDLSALERTLRDLLSHVEEEHGKVDAVSVFPAIGVAAAVTLGRVLMPQVSPALIMYERDRDRVFHRALEVRR